MARDKRTTHQLCFDLAKHGWSFCCNAEMLKGKIINCEEISKDLHPHDKRHVQLDGLRYKLKRLTEKT